MVGAVPLQRWKHRIIGGLACAFLALLGGCSALQFTYQQLPWLAYRWLDRYADFTPEQAPRVKAAIADWLAWQRRQQLPQIAEALDRVPPLLAQDQLAPAQVCREVEAWQRLLGDALAQGVPAAAALARTFSAEQLARVQREQARSLSEARDDHLQPTAEARLDGRVQRALSSFERVYGRLDTAQRQALRDDLARLPFDAERWLAQRQQRQQRLLAVWRGWLAEGADQARVEAGLRGLLDEGQRALTADPEAQRQQRANCALVAQVHQRSTVAQRKRAADTLKGWAADLRQLAVAAAPA